VAVEVVVDLRDCLLVEVEVDDDECFFDDDVEAVLAAEVDADA
jgi:hypothetical protein